MKVLVLSPYIYDEKLTEFTRNKTGFGMVIGDLLKYDSFYDDVSLLTRVIIRERKHNGYTIIRHSWFDIFSSLSLKYFLKGVESAFAFKQNVKNRLRYFYYYLDLGYLKKVIRKQKPDIVHIHGIGYVTKPYIEICQELMIPYVITLHGLNGLSENILSTKQDKEFEKRFLQQSEIDNIPITVISSGIKKRILLYYGLRQADNIIVVGNGTNIEKESDTGFDIRLKYNIPKDCKILLCVGNVSKNKNQKQVVDAFTKIKKHLSKKVMILFLGNDTSNQELQRYICNIGCQSNLLCCGFIDKKDLVSFWKVASLNIVASFSEGFGLSIIEGFVYGVPTVAFSDLDAVEDLYNESAMILVNERSDESLSVGIEKALQFNWNKEQIKLYSKNFSAEKMARKYHDLYLEVVENG